MQKYGTVVEGGQKCCRNLDTGGEIIPSGPAGAPMAPGTSKEASLILEYGICACANQDNRKEIDFYEGFDYWFTI